MLGCIGVRSPSQHQQRRPTFESSLGLRPDARAKLLFQTLQSDTLETMDSSRASTGAQRKYGSDSHLWFIYKRLCWSSRALSRKVRIKGLLSLEHAIGQVQQFSNGRAHNQLRCSLFCSPDAELVFCRLAGYSKSKLVRRAVA